MLGVYKSESSEDDITCQSKVERLKLHCPAAALLHGVRRNRRTLQKCDISQPCNLKYILGLQNTSTVSLRTQSTVSEPRSQIYLELQSLNQYSYRNQ